MSKQHDTRSAEPRRDERDEKEVTPSSIAKTAAEVVVGGAALATDKAIDTVDEVANRAIRAVDRGRDEVEGKARNVAEQTGQAVEAAFEEDRDTRAYEDRTRDELYALAAERHIAGRSNMRKAELIDALRDPRR